MKKSSRYNAPSVGSFFFDNWELTGTIQWMHTRVSGGNTADIRDTLFSNESRDKGQSNTVAVGPGYTVLW